MPTKAEKARHAKVRKFGEKPNFNKQDKDTKEYLHSEYEKALKRLEELRKTEKADSKKLLKQEEIVYNLSGYSK